VKKIKELRKMSKEDLLEEAYTSQIKISILEVRYEEMWRIVNELNLEQKFTKLFYEKHRG